jgi:Family of unknown function (DUF6510)
MDALDGNALAGLLQQVFGTEMTAAPSTCASCGWTGEVARLMVYMGVPGTVVRCRSCTSVVMVFVQRRAMMCVDLRGLAALG